MLLTDYHVHSSFSPDARAEMESQINRAIELGLKEIAFTDHRDYVLHNIAVEPHFNYDIYIKKFSQLKEKYHEKINLILGVEIGLTSGLANEINRFVKSYPFDFVIGSSHDMPTSPLYFGNFFTGKDKHSAYLEYFEAVLENIKTIDCFCVYGHLDYVSRYGIYKDNSLTYGEYKEVIDEILIELIARGKGLELNTSGYRYKLNQLHPSLDILKQYKKLGGEIITVGSDSHVTEHMAEHFDVAQGMLKEAGFTAYTLFRQMKPMWVDI